MKFVKGCTNESCSMNQTKKKFKEPINFCPECGSELVAVCKAKKCHQVLDNPKTVYCATCKAKQDDRKDKVKEGALAAGGVLATGAVVAAKNAGKIAKAATKFLPK